MAEAIVGSMLGKLQQLAISEARNMVAVNEDIRSLRDKLMWMQAFLRHAEPLRRVQPNELIRVWLQQTRDAVFDAEDAVDQYFLRVDLSRFPSWSRAIFSLFASFTIQVQVRHDLSRRIRLINARLDGIITNRDKYKTGEFVPLELTWRPSTSSTTSFSEKLDDVVLPLVGRADKIKELSGALFGQTESAGHSLVISVTGESGVGKTKLVRYMYERHSTKNHFDTLAWVSFGPNLSASDILKLIIHRLNEGETCLKKDVQKALENLLKREQRYLLVIDGEVSNSEWNRIFTLLPKDANAGSRLVRISQSVPEKPVGYGHKKIELKQFDHIEVATQLFKETFFMKDKGEQNNFNIPTDAIDEYSQQIFENTKGLPLAVVLLSGLLRTKEYPEEWKIVFEHLKKMQSKRVDKIMSICFDDLQYDLKSCFLYFAALPVNTLIRAQNLVCMWMAEGFLRPKEGKTMEKVGEQYLKELIDRRLVNLAPMEYTFPGNERVAVQSKVHAFLQLEAQEESFVEIHSGDDIPTLSTARRLSLQNHRDKYAALEYPLPKLRTILSNFEKQDEVVQKSDKEADEADGKENGDGLCQARCPSFSGRGANSREKIKSHVQKLLQNSKFLRVIHFNGLEIDNKLPSEIGNVVHLHYLRVTSCSMAEIPPSIGKLCNLQTLDVRDTNIKKLPPAFWRIKTLRHVFGYRIILPKRVGLLMQLQTLNTVKPDEAEAWDRKTFSKMLRLRSLHIRNVSKANKPALLEALNVLKYLVVLTIKADDDVIPSEVFIRSNLPRLQAMELEGKLEEFEVSKEVIHSHFPNLVKLLLGRTMVSQEFINKLSELKFLTTLQLNQGSYRGDQLVFAADGFHSLKELIIDVKELKRVKIHKLALPLLVELQIIIHCNDLQVEIHDHSSIVTKLRSEDKELFEKIYHVQDDQVEGNNKEAEMSED